MRVFFIYKKIAHRYIQRYVHLYTQTYIHTYIHTKIDNNILTFKHAYIHSYIHTYRHILTYFQWLFYSSIWKKSLTLFLVKTSKEILCKISIFGLWRSTRLVFQLHISVTLPFQAFLLVLFGFLYKTAQKPLKNPSNTAWKTVQKSPQEMSGFWAVFEWFFKQGFSGLSGFSSLNLVKFIKMVQVIETEFTKCMKWTFIHIISTHRKLQMASYFELLNHLRVHNDSPRMLTFVFELSQHGDCGNRVQLTELLEYTFHVFSSCRRLQQFELSVDSGKPCNQFPIAFQNSQRELYLALVRHLTRIEWRKFIATFGASLIVA